MPKGKIKMSVTNPNAGSDDSEKKGKGKFYAGGPGFKELNPKKPKPNVTSEQDRSGGRKQVAPPKKVKPGIYKPGKPRVNDTIRSLIKPDGTRVLRTSGKIRKSRGSR